MKTVWLVFTFTLIAAAQKSALVDFEQMTWPEVKQALADGKTMALVFNGGTEQRGPQGVNGAHTLIARELGHEIAVRLGNAIVAPVFPFSVNNASPDLPGTIGITGLLFAEMNEQIAEQMIANGFKNIVLMGDHGGGQKELEEVATKLDAKYSGRGIRVVYCGDVYKKAGDEFSKWSAEHGYPAGEHASLKDTSELLYLSGDKGWVRKDLIATAVGDPVRKPGEKRDSNAPRANNGIIGDARQSSPDIGKVVTDSKVNAALDEIHRQLSTGTQTAQK